MPRTPDMRHNGAVGSDLQAPHADALIEFVCLAKHRADPLCPSGYSVATLRGVLAYCARGADENHEWVRVPPSRMCDLTIGLMEDRSPAPVTERERLMFSRDTGDRAPH